MAVVQSHLIVACPRCSSRSTKIISLYGGPHGQSFRWMCGRCDHAWIVIARFVGHPNDPLARVLTPATLETASAAEFAAVLSVCSGIAIRAVPATTGWTISTEWSDETLRAVLSRLRGSVAFRVVDAQTVELTFPDA